MTTDKIAELPDPTTVRVKRQRIRSIFGSMPYGGICNFHFCNSYDTLSEYEFLSDVESNLAKLMNVLQNYSKQTNLQVKELYILQQQRTAIREFLGIESK